MRYTFDVYNTLDIRLETSTSIDALEFIPAHSYFPEGYRIEVYDGLQKKQVATLRSHADIDGWNEARMRDVWLDKEDKQAREAEMIRLGLAGSAEQEAPLVGQSRAPSGVWNPFDEVESGIHMKDKPTFSISTQPNITGIGNSGSCLSAGTITGVTGFSSALTTGPSSFLSSISTTKDPINPPHYKEVVPGMQYMEMMQYMLKGHEPLEAHLLGQVYKYLMRTGKKDASLTELKKAKWYLDFLVAYLAGGSKPIKIDDIEKMLKA